MDKDNSTLGQKIRNFRKRAGMSQLDLELAIDSSPGSLSRIESGEVNPTKETLLKIIEILDLKTYEAATLFNLDLNELPKLVKLSRKLTGSLDLDTILQNSVNDIVVELNLLGSLIFLIEDEKIYCKTITKAGYTSLVENILGDKVNKLEAPLRDIKYRDNLTIKTVQDNKIYYSNRLSDFSVPVISRTVSNLIQGVTRTASIICLPLSIGDRVIGAILFTKHYVDNFENELLALEAFSEHVSECISNAQKYNNLQIELNKLKNGK